MYFEITKDKFLLSTNKTLLDVNSVHQYLSEESYWAKGIPKEKVIKSIDNSFCVGIYEEGKQVAFARIITDYTAFAYLCDVYVVKEYQGMGLGEGSEGH